MTREPRTWFAVPDQSELCSTIESAKIWSEDKHEIVEVIEKWAYDEMVAECKRLQTRVANKGDE